MSDVDVDLDDDVDDGNRLEGSVPRAVLEYLAKAIVDDPDSVVVEVEEGRTTSLRLNVSPDDMGRVIGRRGRTAQAIRTVVRAAAAREGMDVHVDVVAATGGDCCLFRRTKLASLDGPSVRLWRT
jgi:predicted RNA-binding protein YlqC (UPF0109 family)